jgi:hypothetical protein
MLINGTTNDGASILGAGTFKPSERKTLAWRQRCLPLLYCRWWCHFGLKVDLEIMLKLPRRMCQTLNAGTCRNHRCW